MSNILDFTDMKNCEIEETGEMLLAFTQGRVGNSKFLKRELSRNSKISIQKGDLNVSILDEHDGTWILNDDKQVVPIVIVDSVNYDEDEILKERSRSVNEIISCNFSVRSEDPEGEMIVFIASLYGIDIQIDGGSHVEIDSLIEFCSVMYKEDDEPKGFIDDMTISYIKEQMVTGSEYSKCKLDTYAYQMIIEIFGVECESDDFTEFMFLFDRATEDLNWDWEDDYRKCLDGLYQYSKKNESFRNLESIELCKIYKIILFKTIGWEADRYTSLEDEDWCAKFVKYYEENIEKEDTSKADHKIVMEDMAVPEVLFFTISSPHDNIVAIAMVVNGSVVGSRESIDCNIDTEFNRMLSSSEILASALNVKLKISLLHSDKISLGTEGEIDWKENIARSTIAVKEKTVDKS